MILISMGNPASGFAKPTRCEPMILDLTVFVADVRLLSAGCSTEFEKRVIHLVYDNTISYDV